jgi:hypothetical protein
VTSSEQSAPIAARVLDLAFLGDDQLAVLLADGVSLFRREGAALRRTDHRPLDASVVVRAPAGIIAAGAGAFWVATNMAEGAVLFTADGGRLQETQRADALPFTGSPRGARFHSGTNLIDVSIAGLGSGPHLRAGGGESPWAIAPDGRLGSHRGGWTGARVGSAAALLWPGTWIASSAEPPGAGDALSVTGAGAAPAVVIATFPAPSAVTAIGARGAGNHALVAAAVAEGGRHRLVLMEVTRAP